MMTSVFRRDLVSTQAIVVLPVVQPIVILQLDTRKISINAVHAHVTQSSVHHPTSVVGETMETEILSLDQDNMDTTKQPAEKSVTSIHSLRYSTMAGVHVIIPLEILSKLILKLKTNYATMVTLKLVKAWEEHGLMLFTQTTFMWKTKARPSLDVSVTTATEISILDQDNTVSLLQHAEKPVSIIHILPCSTMAGAHATTRMVIQYLHTHKLMTKTAIIMLDGVKVVPGQTQCFQIIFILRGTFTHLMMQTIIRLVKRTNSNL
jgi:hypothetical protein